MLNVGDKCYRIMCSKFIVTSYYRKGDEIFLGDILFEKPEEAQERLKVIYKDCGWEISDKNLKIIERS